jgi:serine/threonine protein kinase
VSELPLHAVRRLQQAASEPDLGPRFTVVQPLGRGGMGAVWLAHDEELQREVAVKVIAQPLQDDEAQQRLLHEARILARLEHPGLVPVHDAGLLPDGRAWYAMKRVRGLRLDEHVTEATPLAERLRIFERLCETLAFAHARGVLHRDLKPGNVMVGEFGEVLVLDWGVARVLGGAAPEGGGVVLGTPGWMPPEQAEGRSAEADVRSDTWGLGALLHWLLRLQPPPAVDDPRRFGGGVPRALEAICRKALARAPENRYASVGDLREDVARFRDGAAVQALPEGPLSAGLRLLQRHRVAVALVLAYLVMRAALALGFGR